MKLLSLRCRLSRNVLSVKERQLYSQAKLSSANVNVHYFYALVVLASCDLHVLFASQLPKKKELRQCPTKSKLRFYNSETTLEGNKWLKKQQANYVERARLPIYLQIH